MRAYTVCSNDNLLREEFEESDKIVHTLKLPY